VLSVVVTPVIDYVVRNQCKPPVRLKVKAVRTADDPESEPYGMVSPLDENDGATDSRTE
jgi:hypothetical protein